MGRAVVRFEIGCRDRARTESFYRDLFEWYTAPMGPYATGIETLAGHGIDGHITALGHEPHHYVMVYVEVDDIQATLARVEALGGRTLVPRTPIPTGHFAWIADPEGTRVGLLEPAKPA